MAKNSPKSLDFGQQSDQSPAQPGRNHLLLIGIDRYQHVGQLNNAERDAQAFGQLLQDKYQFDADHITALYDQQATGEAIAWAFRQLIGRVKPGDNLVVYFSGHGHYDTVLEEGYWVPVEARFMASLVLGRSSTREALARSALSLRSFFSLCVHIIRKLESVG